MRIVLRIGGSVIASPVNTELISKYADLLKTLKKQGHEVAVVVGGGSLVESLLPLRRNWDLTSKLRMKLPFLFQGFSLSFS